MLKANMASSLILLVWTQMFLTHLRSPHCQSVINKPTMYISPFMSHLGTSQSHGFLESIDLEYLLSSPDPILWQCSKKECIQVAPSIMLGSLLYINYYWNTEQIYPQLSSCTYSAIYWRPDVTSFDVLVHLKLKKPDVIGLLRWRCFFLPFRYRMLL